MVASNHDAIVADERFLAERGAMNFYTLYRSHDYHFKIYGALFAGQSRVALETVARLEASIPEEALRVESPPMADWLEGFLAMRVHALIRFGRWDDIVALPLPTDPDLYCVTTAMTHYAKEIRARRERPGAGRRAGARAVRRRVRPGAGVADAVQQHLPGHPGRRRGDARRRAGVPEGQPRRRSSTCAGRSRLDDGLPYDEPWGWMQPTRHAYGALLLEQGRVEEAAAVYRADLGLDDALPRALQHPGNVWSLHGYYECLVSLGRTDEELDHRAAGTAREGRRRRADRASCFCRLSVGHCC